MTNFHALFHSLLIPCCSASASKTDLVDALTALIDSLETGALLPPISKSNPTPFGKLIRDCIRLHSLRTAAASQTEALQSHIEGGFDGLLENVWEGVSMLGIWKLGRDARNLLQGVVDNEILDLLLVNPATKIPYGCTPDAVPAVSDEELEALEDQTGYEIKWAVKVLRALWRAYEISRFVSENAIGVPKVSVKGVVEGVLKEVVDEAKERAKAVLLRERGEKVPGWTVGEVKKGGVFRVSLPRVSVATSKFVGHVARRWDLQWWTTKDTMADGDHQQLPTSGVERYIETTGNGIRFGLGSDIDAHATKGSGTAGGVICCSAGCCRRRRCRPFAGRHAGPYYCGSRSVACPAHRKQRAIWRGQRRRGADRLRCAACR